MNATLSQIASKLEPLSLRRFLVPFLSALARSQSSRMLNTAGLVIKAGASALVKTGAAACHAAVKGTLVSIAAATDMAALSGTVTNAKFNVYAYFVTNAGVLSTVMGKEGATLAAVVFPAIPIDKTLIGFTIINPTGTGNFVGGTTAIDDATVVPNAVHVSVIGAFDPTVLV